MQNLFIKKNSSPNTYKPILNHASKLLPFLSSKLSVKLSRSRNLYFAFEKFLKLSRFLKLSNSFSRSRCLYVNLQSDYSLRNVSSSKLTSGTLLNARRNSISKDFKLCRISLRSLASSGYLPGVFKSSW